MKSHEVYDSDDESSDEELKSVGVSGLFILLLPVGIVGVLVFLFLL